MSLEGLAGASSAGTFGAAGGADRALDGGPDGQNVRPRCRARAGRSRWPAASWTSREVPGLMADVIAIVRGERGAGSADIRPGVR
jgi:hypothetical protein